VLLSRGTESPVWLATILDRLAATLPQAQRQTIEEAGHVPHVTHPQQYLASLTRFIRET